MRTIILLPALTLFFFYGCVQNNILNLDYQSFDQSPNAGWRRLAQEGRFAESANLIDRYLKKHKDLDPSETVNLHFHAGQMYAFADDYEAALEHLKKARYAQEFEGIPEDVKAFLDAWNSYVEATIAFLQRDKMKILRCRERIANGPKIDGKIPNLDIIDSLINHFDLPYSKAYGVHKQKS
jgi:hypothetical protein